MLLTISNQDSLDGISARCKASLPTQNRITGNDADNHPKLTEMRIHDPSVKVDKTHAPSDQRNFIRY